MLIDREQDSFLFARARQRLPLLRGWRNREEGQMGITITQLLAQALHQACKYKYTCT